MATTAERAFRHSRAAWLHLASSARIKGKGTRPGPEALPSSKGQQTRVRGMSSGCQGPLARAGEQAAAPHVSSMHRDSISLQPAAAATLSAATNDPILTSVADGAA
ncbi:uncharacterized protein PAN0_003d1670 [Moesziomyces antarcticus]|uniref:uncharacterized protein n=1 Tax=Pseudozyma antarctica TaxID=84753 RepID=UPI0007197077|nr:uncharacterized protein PAN0_003d1670 [Moesziomyces antarcticus]GAK63465.1 hypothetical protein PAN0_003d1670 [Moesziomyces antarcticus]